MFKDENEKEWLTPEETATLIKSLGGRATESGLATKRYHRTGPPPYKAKNWQHHLRPFWYYGMVES